MQKAYELKALGDKLAAKGLPVLENTAEEVYEAVKEWFVESAKLSASPIDDMIVPFLGFVDGIVKPAIDKIDGEPG